MDRKIQFASDEYYHLYARGIEKKEIFRNTSDYWRFLMLLYVANSDKTIHLSDYSLDQLSKIFSLPRNNTLIDIGAYCLMPNHWHLLVKAKSDSGVSLFMRKLLTGYSMFFNKKYDRTGGLFERPFKARHINDDDYLNYLLAYIHLNPIKIKDPDSWSGKRIKNPKLADDFLNNYRFSSYSFYCAEDRPENPIIQKNIFPESSLKPDDFKELIKNWVNFDY